MSHQPLKIYNQSIYHWDFYALLGF
ncbi:hypothetical protein M2L65_002880 [Staphylococcus pseudintermedius]|nr:hypothetical protein [Staphylococcus pseudintermedius]